MKFCNLDVYLHNRLAGKLRQGEGGRLDFAYDSAYVIDKAAHPLSVSMPLSGAVYDDAVARPYFSGFLPDDLIRHRLAEFFGVSEKNEFALLREVGGECAGAVALYPEGEKPLDVASDDFEILDERKLAKYLDALHSRPLLAGSEGLRLSLAGAQDKLPVALKDGHIALAKGGSPTTHIIKPPIERVSDSVYNELFCLKLAARLRLPVVRAELGFADGNPYLLVERYDRALDGNGRIRRLHQEDFCQALSIAPEQKYEREGGPGVARCLELLERSSAQPAVDKLFFLKMLIFNYLIGNADCHGKNFSLLHNNGNSRLAPAYDLMCTAAYPGAQKKLAMKIGGTYDPDLIFRRHWHRLVADTAVARRSMERNLNDMAAEVGRGYAELVRDFAAQGVVSGIFDDIGRVIELRTRQLLEAY
ncbi:MAG: type II toxin-antitoxin system HipA family toxin [Bdellovibrionales bacterium]